MLPTLYGGGEVAQSRFIFMKIGMRGRGRPDRHDATFVIWKNMRYINQLRACALLVRNDGSDREKAAEIYSAAIFPCDAVAAALFMKRAMRGTISARKREPLKTP